MALSLLWPCYVSITAVAKVVSTQGPSLLLVVSLLLFHQPGPKSLLASRSVVVFLQVDRTLHDKTNKISVRPAKTQISLGIRPVWSESSLCVHWVAKDPSLLHADSEDSDQTGRMPRLIWVFAGRTVILLVLSCRGSYALLGLHSGEFTLRNIVVHQPELHRFCTYLMRIKSAFTFTSLRSTLVHITSC